MIKLKWKTEQRKINDLVPYEFNPRVISKKQVQDLKESLEKFDLAERAIKKSSEMDDIVLDVFGGSGSTLICCEQMSRVSYNMELDPKYCDVIIKRYEKFTGDTCELA